MCHGTSETSSVSVPEMKSGFSIFICHSVHLCFVRKIGLLIHNWDVSFQTQCLTLLLFEERMIICVKDALKR